MATFTKWLKIRETGVPYVGQDPGGASGGWQGAPSGGKLRSVGDVKLTAKEKNKKPRRKKKRKTKK
jgi:hypothetical protein